MVTSYDRAQICRRIAFYTLFLWVLLLFSGFLALAIDKTISVYLLLSSTVTMILYIAVMLTRLYIVFNCLKPSVIKPSIPLAQVPPMLIINPDNTYHIGIPMYTKPQVQSHIQTEIPIYVAHIESV